MIVCPAAVIYYPKGSTVVIVLVHVSLVVPSAVHEVLKVVDGAQDVIVAVASTVGVDRHALRVVSTASEVAQSLIR